MQPEEENKSKREAIDINQIDLERLKDKIAENPGLLPYAHTSGSAVVKPEDMHRVLARSMTAMDQQTDMQMQQIIKQMHLLADQAKTIQDRKVISERIYQAELRFEPVIGHTYYFYHKDNRDILSLVAPQEWGRSNRHLFTYIAKVRLLADHTWDILEVAPEVASIQVSE